MISLIDPNHPRCPEVRSTTNEHEPASKKDREPRRKKIPGEYRPNQRNFELPSAPNCG